jgi:hypothetical protein
MQRSSESIAALAGALAKAQPELLNPEKSLIAAIPGGRGGQGQSFRYAPLSSGLEIVRKTLGKHELSVMQTTAIDEASRTVKLTTVLAHASGEWIASDWPVCSLNDVSVPHRMGTALTYARRYSLFALVGIAGEDDLDAPDARTADPARDDGEKHAVFENGPARSRSAGKIVEARPVALEPNASASARDRLIAECTGLQSVEEATGWAHMALKAKNTLTLLDAEAVETAFAQCLADLSAANEQQQAPSNPASSAPPRAKSANAKPRRSCRVRQVLVKTSRRRDKAHLEFVQKQPCLVCGRKPCDPHHVRFAQPRALGRKVSDEFTVPLCRTHHREVHRCGDETVWWTKIGVKPLPVAHKLWSQSHGDGAPDGGRGDVQGVAYLPNNSVPGATIVRNGEGDGDGSDRRKLDVR